MNHPRTTFEEALKQAICFSQNKAKVMWKCAKGATFKCPAFKNLHVFGPLLSIL